MEEVKELYKEGFSLARVSKGLGQGKAPYILVKSSDGVRVKELPPFVLNYIQGSITRRYKDNWFVKMEEFDPDKQKFVEIETLSSHKMRGQAALEAKKLNSANKDSNIKYIHREDMNIRLAEGLSEARNSYLKNTGRLYFSKRKEVQLKNSVTQDPYESITSSIFGISRKVGIQPMTQKEKARWVVSWGKRWGMKEFPVTYHQLLSKLEGAVSLSDPVVKKAIADWAMIKHTEEIADPFTFRVNRIIENIGNSLFDKGWKRTGEFVVDHHTAFESAWSTAKTINFMRFLATAPVRQFFLQGAQPSILVAMDPKYMLSGGAFRDNVAIWSVFRAIERGEDVKDMSKVLSNVSTYTPEEIKIMGEAFYQTGIKQGVFKNSTVTSHMKLSQVQAWGDSTIKKGVKGVSNVVTFLPRLGAKGFEAGEMANMTTNWLLAIRRYMGENPNLTIKEIFKGEKAEIHKTKIMGITRGIGLNMTEMGAMGWQKGAFSLATQFQAINAKTLLAMTGRNQYIQGANLLKLWGAMVVEYGAHGIGVGKQVNKLIDSYEEQHGEVSSEVRSVLVGGLTDLMFFTLTGVNAEMAKAFSPSGGMWFMNDMLRDAIGTGEYGDKSFLQILAGPTGQTASDVYNLRGAFLYGMNPNNWKGDGGMESVVWEFLDFVPQLKRIDQYRFAMKNDNWIRQYGSDKLQLSWKEFMVNVFLGIKTYDQSLLDRVKRSTKEIETDFRDAVNMFIDRQNRIVKENIIDGKLVGSPSRFATILANSNKFLATFEDDPKTREVIWGMIWRKAKNEPDNWLNYLGYNAMKNRYGSYSDYVLDITNRLRKQGVSEDEIKELEGIIEEK